MQQWCSPIGPAPMMATVFPGVTPARLTACTPTDRGSTMAPSSCDRWSGKRKQKSAGWSTNCTEIGTRYHWTDTTGRRSGHLHYLGLAEQLPLLRDIYGQAKLPIVRSEIIMPLYEGAVHGCERGLTCAKDPWCGGVAKNLMSGSRLYRPSLQDHNAVVSFPLGEWTMQSYQSHVSGAVNTSRRFSHVLLHMQALKSVKRQCTNERWPA